MQNCPRETAPDVSYDPVEVWTMHDASVCKEEKKLSHMVKSKTHNPEMRNPT